MGGDNWAGVVTHQGTSGWTDARTTTLPYWPMAIMGVFSSHVRSPAGFALAIFSLTLARLEIEIEEAFGFLASLPRGLH